MKRLAAAAAMFLGSVTSLIGQSPGESPDANAAGVLLEVGASGGDETEGSSPWYLERGTERRQPRAEDDVPEVAFDLAELLRDGGIPGFYDGQFERVQNRFDDLVRVAQDRSMHHTIRIMAVMALQESADGERLLAALEPLLIAPEEEFSVEYSRAYREFQRQAPRPLDEKAHRRELDVDLSRYARFALAKDGQSAPIMERIEVLERYVWPRRVSLLDPLVRTFRDFQTFLGRTIWFDIGYHYQQLRRELLGEAAGVEEAGDSQSAR